MEQSNLITNLVRRWYVFVVIILLLVIFSIIRGTGFIKITLSPEDKQEATINIVNQKTGKKTIIKTDSSTVTKRVPKGQYEVSVSRGETSSVSQTSTSGFFQATEVTSQLKEESARTFVGNNPKTCMYTSGGALFSYYCGDGYKQVVEHVPTNAKLPTHTIQNKDTKISGSVRGAVKLASGTTLVLISDLQTEDTTKPRHTVYTSSGFNLSSPVVLRDLDNNLNYQIALFEDGFIAYNDKVTQVLYYSSPTAKPQKLDVPAPSDTSLKHTLFGSNASTIVVSRSDKADFQTHDDLNAKIGKVKTEVVILTKDGSHTISFTQDFEDILSGVLPCGNKLCFVSKKKLYVYDITGDKAKLDYTVGDVNSVFGVGGDMLLVRSDGVMAFDANNGSGYLDYGFGGKFSYCGSQPNGVSNYLLCIKDSSGGLYALSVDRSTKNTGSIDKKFAELLKNVAFKAVSVNGKYIYFTADIPLTYNKLSSEYEYDPVAKKAAIATMNSEVDRLGIDRKVYTIINTSGN